MLGSQPHHVEGADQVDPDDLLEICERKDRLAAENAPGRTNTGAVDQDPQTVSGFGRRRESCCRRRLVHHIADMGGGADLACDLFRSVAIAVEQMHHRATGGQHARHRLAKPGAAACHKCACTFDDHAASSLLALITPATSS